MQAVPQFFSFHDVTFETPFNPMVWLQANAAADIHSKI
jgi:hypothetical protein